MPLLPSSPSSEAGDDAVPRVIGVDSEDADALLGALSSETARRILTELHDEPAHPSALAARIDSSLQNVQYHLERLESAGAISVVDTIYSEKGREMKVYAPADKPLVIFAGREQETGGLRNAVARLFSGVAILAGASLAVQAWAGRNGLGLGGGSDESATQTATTAAQTATASADGGGAGGFSVAEATTEATTETATQTAEAATYATDAATTATQGVGLPPEPSSLPVGLSCCSRGQ
ncbi:ArsR/SmtB family transcription factor [Haladaptatus sp. GCM10025707]|uniref:ArsR/SmtB family transcription factor n=1 Tax=Haladaptatus sp. GCM10025707 TaxID=3252658 RepID=UPI00361619CE